MSANLLDCLKPFGIVSEQDAIYAYDGVKAVRASTLGITPSPRIMPVLLAPMKQTRKAVNNDRTVSLLTNADVAGAMLRRKMTWIIVFSGQALQVTPANVIFLLAIARAVLDGGVAPVLAKAKLTIATFDPAKHVTWIYKRVPVNRTEVTAEPSKTESFGEKLDGAFGKVTRARNARKQPAPATATSGK